MTRACGIALRRVEYSQKDNKKDDKALLHTSLLCSSSCFGATLISLCLTQDSDVNERLTELASSVFTLCLPHLSVKQQIDLYHSRPASPSSPLSLRRLLLRALSCGAGSSAAQSVLALSAWSGYASPPELRTIWERVAHLKDPFLRQRLVSGRQKEQWESHISL